MELKTHHTSIYFGVPTMTVRPVRRVVTGHDASGKAVAIIDGNAPNQKVRAAAGGITSTLLWATDESPANVSASHDRAVRESGVAPPANGTVFRIVDFPPTDESKIDNTAMLKEMGLAAGSAPAKHGTMHRTRSIDYAIVLDGEIDMVMDDSEVHFVAGDVLVQQGTNHAWVNRGTKVCRIAFVLIDGVAPSAWKLTPNEGH
jgi:mannose-6-phosphate isomerase-like protein (cupin superfamily)